MLQEKNGKVGAKLLTLTSKKRLFGLNLSTQLFIYCKLLTSMLIIRYFQNYFQKRLKVGACPTSPTLLL
jgi:hypothetical protein